jgi:hypothetical protein
MAGCTTVKIEGEKGQINLRKLNILCNCHATSKSYLKLKQMPPQPPAAEVTLQCMGSWFSAIGCPLQNTNCSTSLAFCTFSRPPSDESTRLVVHCRTQIAALLQPYAPSVILHQMSPLKHGNITRLPTHTEVATLGFLLV